MVDMIIKEIYLRNDYLPSNHLHSIYFGGGTPSLLTLAQIENIFRAIYDIYDVDQKAEITLEANPDDLSPKKIALLRQTPINRLSIGVQSFFDADLAYMNRAHNQEEAKKCIDYALQAGFTNLTIDLIYGSPTTSNDQWYENLKIAFGTGINHLSAYCLTVEPRTALDHFIRTGKQKPVDERQASKQFDLLIKEAETHGFEQYEISNFARSNAYAVHNTSYWQGKPYLGIGPSAHSFDGNSRQWTKANNAAYIRELQHTNHQRFPTSIYDQEKITPTVRYNEYVMTGLRTKWGVDTAQMTSRFRDHFLLEVKKHLKAEKMWVRGTTYGLTKAGRILADGIASDLFYMENEY